MKIERRGGKKKKSAAPDAQALLIDEIIQHFGGPRKLAAYVTARSNGFKFHHQNFINWRNRNGVPLAECFHLARILKISPLALNFRKVKKVQKNWQPWPYVVRGISFLPPVAVKSVLAAKEPQ